MHVLPTLLLLHGSSNFCELSSPVFVIVGEFFGLISFTSTRSSSLTSSLLVCRLAFDGTMEGTSTVLC